MKGAGVASCSNWGSCIGSVSVPTPEEVTVRSVASMCNEYIAKASSVRCLETCVYAFAERLCEGIR